MTRESRREPIEPEHPEQDQLREGGSDDGERKQRADRLGIRNVRRELEERERKQDEPAGEHRAGRQHGAGHRLDSQLPVDSGARVAERREDDGERARDRDPAACRVETGKHGDPDESDRDPDDARHADRLVRQEACGQEEREDGHGRLRDPRDARVDVLLAPRDEPERDGRVQRAEHEGRTPVRAQRDARRGRDPIVTARYGMSRSPARSARAAIIGAGSMSSTATLMRTYDTPQIAASRNNMGQ